MLNKLKPTTPSQRHTVLLKNKKMKIKFPFLRKLSKGFQRSNGRNNQGKITVRHKGGGHKRVYRKIHFKRQYLDYNKAVCLSFPLLSRSVLQKTNGVVVDIEYDPNRSANIASVLFFNNVEKKDKIKSIIKSNPNLIKTTCGLKNLEEGGNIFFYILAPQNLNVGDCIHSGEESPIKIGNALPLSHIPIGSTVHNIGILPGGPGKLARSAGTSAQLLQKSDRYAKIRLSSGVQVQLLLSCYATIGSVSNFEHKNIKLGKAGRSRWLNIRPKVRGVAKNPVDHPHGGGEGKTSGGRPSVSFTGKLTKGQPTRQKNKRTIRIQ